MRLDMKAVLVAEVVALAAAGIWLYKRKKKNYTTAKIIY